MNTSALYRTLSALRLAVGAIWLFSLFVHVEYARPLTPFGPIGDASSRGYARVMACGVSAGAIVIEDRRRTERIGWEFEMCDRLPYLLPYFYGSWPNRVYALPLFLPAILIHLILRSRRSAASINTA